MQQPSNIIYLASKSPRRRELLRQIGVQYELLLMRELAPRIDIDEAPRPEETPHAYVERVVRLKADVAVKVMRERKLPVRPILTADTTVTFDGEILGKPADRDDAVRMLKRLSGENPSGVNCGHGDQCRRELYGAHHQLRDVLCLKRRPSAPIR